MRVPDYVEPLVGWRVWDVVEAEGELRLRSVGFKAVWPPGRGAAALCRRSLENLAWAGLSLHPAPHEQCGCGIYAVRTAAQAAVYFTRPFLWQWSAIHRVIGTVSLWGTVVEGAFGWRASSTYPAALYVPAPKRGLRSFLAGLPRPSLPLQEVVAGLAHYGVPVEPVGCATVRGLAAALEAAEGARL